MRGRAVTMQLTFGMLGFAVGAHAKDILRGASRLRRLGEPDPTAMHHALQYSYKNPYVENFGGYKIEPSWGGNWAVTAPGLDTREWDADKWAWVSKEAPAPAPAPAAPSGPAPEPPPPVHNALPEMNDCKAFQKATKEDYPDDGAFECHILRMYGSGGPLNHMSGDGCYCYAWTTNCPYETCTGGNMWEGKYCLDDRAKNEFKFEAVSKWQVSAISPLFNSFKHHPHNVALCAYWAAKPALPAYQPLPTIDKAKWHRVQTVLAFQGLSLAGCYDATQPSNYEKTRADLAKKLGVDVTIEYMICAEGGATPEWKFLQLEERTRRNGTHARVQLAGREGDDGVPGTWHPRAPNLALLQQRDPAWDPYLAGRPACAMAIAAGERNKEGCPTDPPIMFPYTKTATLTAEITGLPGEVQKASAENEKADFCFPVSSSKLQPEICSQWESGKPCCMVAPVTPEPAAPE